MPLQDRPERTLGPQGSALEKAVSERDKEAVQSLLNSGISPTIKAIQYSIIQRDVEILTLLLERNTEMLPSNLLKIPIENNDVETVHVLLDHGIQIHDNEEYALRLASYMGEETGDFSIVELLLEAGANVHVNNNQLLEDQLLLELENTELLKLLLQYSLMDENNIKQFLRYPHLRKDILRRTEELLHKKRILSAQDLEKKNEEKRQSFLEEIKRNNDIETKENSFVSQNCASTESLYGDPLKDTDDIVIFEISGVKSDCYLRKELKLLRSDQHVRGTGERVYRLPWSGVWISESTKNLAETWEETVSIKLIKSEDDYVGYDKNKYLYVIDPLESS